MDVCGEHAALLVEMASGAVRRAFANSLELECSMTRQAFPKEIAAGHLPGRDCSSALPGPAEL